MLNPQTERKECCMSKMESFQSFTFGLWNAARLSCAVQRICPLGIVRSFSTWEKPSPGEPGKENSEELPCSPTDHRLETAEHEGAVQPTLKPLYKTHKDRTPQSKFWQKFHTKTVPSSGEELRNLRNDDFPEEKRKLLQKPVPVERTKGSEILFGISPCSLALMRSKRNFSQLFLKAGSSGMSPALKEFSRRAKECGVPVKMVRRKVLDALCKGGVHQGVCLEATPLRPTGWQEGLSPGAEGATVGEGSQLLWLALEGIQDPMNLGAVLRTAHFLGVDGIVMSQRNSCPLTPVVSKASSGAMEVLDVFTTEDLQSLLKAKSDQGWEVLGTVGYKKVQDAVPTVSCLDFRWTRPTILLLGNEGYGLSPETRSLCQRMLTISPGRELQPGIESLNVSVAAGILLHSICSQKEKAQ
ncbi:rRNA methyltransferase 1, mitochondrial isoform X2 [Rhineura floridana]|uniref:rRNA methyltransferase 1, mitochondrial isoform X2 n=1 Tax=Rhineura floridana TaxID=261503 RepID=UPI002AC7F71E|nr:rRNA methyltransferase 1, mitochondrial isoform X2 [Rhineura floridana]